MRKVFLSLITLLAVLSLVSCNNDKDDNKGYDYDAIPDAMESSNGYEIAFVTDIGQLKDKSFNQGT